MQRLLGLFFIFLLNHLAIGAGDKGDVKVCQNETAFLKWPGAPTSADNIEYQLWYIGSKLIARWSKEEGFYEFYPCDGRLTYIGVSDIMIHKTHHADSGPYQLSWKCKSAVNSSTVTINLQVIVPPTNHCIPNITKEGETLRAVLPPYDCGNPRLVPSWRSGNQELINGNISVLSIGSEPVPGIYTACANGYSTRCFLGDVLKLCSDYTAFQSQNESSSVSVEVIIISITIPLALLALVVCVWWNWECIRRKFFAGTSTRETAEKTDIKTALMDNTATGTSTRETAEKTDIETALMDNTATESAESLDIDTMLKEKLQMQQKQKQEPGSNHTGKDEVKDCNKKQRAKYPQFQAFASRLKMFEAWPRDHWLQPKELAEAGFFYQGNGDSVTCFFCGEVLGDWAADDNAWAEHERCNPSCEHVRSHKKAGSSPGDSDEIEEIQDIQSRDETVQEEQCILNKEDEKKNEKPQIIEGHLLCRICQKQNAITFLPCRHTTACRACAEELKECNLCQKMIVAIVLPYAKE